MATRLAVVSLFAITTGCAGTRPVPTHPAPKSAAAPTVAAQNVHEKGPSNTSAERWPFDRDPPFVLHADVAGLRRTELGRQLFPAIVQSLRGVADEAQIGCLRDALESVNRVAVGGGLGDSMAFVVKYDPSGMRSTLASCAKLMGARPAHIPGAREAYSFPQATMAADGEWLVAGTPELVERAFARRSQTGPKLQLAGDRFIAWRASLPGKADASGTVLASPARFRVEAALDMADPRDADQLERAFLHARAEWRQVGTPEGVPANAADRLLAALALRRDSDRRVVASFELAGPAGDQSRDLGFAAALGIYGVRKYLAQAKMAEARYTVAQISKDIASWRTPEDVHGRTAASKKKRKLASYPPVPAEVPRGTKYQSSSDDWKAWQDLRFSMTEPQYYQYQVRAAKDGNSAEIIARGDLDGDGKLSTFSLHVKVDEKTGDFLIAPVIVETDPEE